MSTLLLGGLLGLMLGLAWCYWQQIQTVYKNRDLISSVSNLQNDASNLVNQLQKL